MATNETLKLIVQELTNKNLFLHVKEQSLFKAIDQNASDANLICTNLATKINNELILIKNKLRPFMNELATEIEKKLNETQVESEISKYQIHASDLPSVIGELELLGTITKKSRAPLDIGTSQVSIPVPAADKIVEYFVHPNSAVNISIANIVSKGTVEDLNKVWDKYLTSVSNTNENIKAMGFDLMEKINELLLLHTALLNLTKEQGTDTKTLELLNLLLNEVNNYLSIAKENVENGRKAGQLVLKLEQYRAIVDKVLYDQFISEGNSPEVILGFILKGDSGLASLLYNEIVKHKQEYLDLWNSKVQLASFQDSNNNIKRYKTVYDIVLTNLFDQDQIPNDLKELVSGGYGDAKPRLDKLLSEYKPEEIVDYNLVARDIVGLVLFPSTNFQHFAQSITSYSALNPNITPQDAATTASLDFILDFLLAQVYVGDIYGKPADQ